MGEVDLPGILVLQLFQAAARAAIAQALPFDVGHVLQRLGFPEKSLLARGPLGRCGHESRWFRVSLSPSYRPFIGARLAKLQVGCFTPALGGVSPAAENRKPDHWFIAPARLD